MAATKKEKSDRYAGITPEKYARLLDAFIKLPSPTVQELAQAADVGPGMVKKALTEGWPNLGLPPLSAAHDNLVDPAKVAEAMSGMVEQKKQIMQGFFGPLPTQTVEDVANTSTKMVTDVVATEAAQRAAESGMAARVAMANAVMTGRVVQAFTEEIQTRIMNGQYDLPETIKLEHLYMLAKITDIAGGNIHRAMQTERLSLGQPETTTGANIAALIIGASPEELKAIIATGTLPPRLLGIAAPQEKPKTNVIDVEAKAVDDKTP